MSTTTAGPYRDYGGQHLARTELSARAPGTPPVHHLTFHGVGPRTRSMDEGEAAVWVTTDEFEAILDAVVGRPQVRISFDDGNASDVTVALPRLVERGLTAQFFVLAGMLDQPDRLTRSGVLQIRDAGMHVGSHGWSHRSWRGMPEPEATREIIEAKAELEQLIGSAITAAAVPFGLYDRSALHRLRRAGYARVFTSDGGPARTSSWLQARNSVHAGDQPQDIARLVDVSESPALWATRRAKRFVKRWR